MSADNPLILVVDDNEMNRDMLARRLDRQQYRTETADNGERALEMMREQSFDLVLLDIMMPRMNGYQVLEIAKADDALRNTPIIMISAVDDLDSVVKCIEMGAEDYLFKPFNPVLLKARVSASIERKRMLDSVKAGITPGLRTLLNAIQDDVNALRQHSSNFNDDQLLVLARLIENTRRAADA
ncbi:MAG: response regulator [Armatimonadetes bacterium]|nr:response regulator [Anaerolineae bacterium]